MLFPFRPAAVPTNWERIIQPRPDYGLEFQVKVLKTFQAVSCSLNRTGPPRDGGARLGTVPPTPGRWCTVKSCIFSWGAWWGTVVPTAARTFGWVAPTALPKGVVLLVLPLPAGMGSTDSGFDGGARAEELPEDLLLDQARHQLAQQRHLLSSGHEPLLLVLPLPALPLVLPTRCRYRGGPRRPSAGSGTPPACTAAQPVPPPHQVMSLQVWLMTINLTIKRHQLAIRATCPAGRQLSHDCKATMHPQDAWLIT